MGVEVVDDSVDGDDGEAEVEGGESVLHGAVVVDLELFEVGEPTVGSFDDPASF